MNNSLSNTYTSFQGHRLIKSGPLSDVALAIKRVTENHPNEPVLIFSDITGRSVDINTRGSEAEVLARFTADDKFDKADETNPDAKEPRGRGRPKLGVVAREVTLLPRHWEWLSTQPGGASVALRKLVDEARRANSERDNSRGAQERAYYFMSAIAGDMPGFEEASRALFANDRAKFSTLIASWPIDVRMHATWLAYGDRTQSNEKT